MNVIIIEDEPLAASRLEKMIKKYDAEISVIAKLVSVNEAVMWISNNLQPDLIFMDIKLEDGNSFAIFEKIKIKSPVIFTTAYENYMINAFKVNSIDYLLKPINLEDLSRSINKYKDLQNQYNNQSVDLKKLIEIFKLKDNAYKNHFVITLGQKVKIVETTEIAYFYYDERITFIITNDDKRYPVDFSLDKLMEMLNTSMFFRLNRQYIIKRSSIDNIELLQKRKYRLTLKPKTDKEIIVSSYRSEAFKNWLNS